MMDEDQMTDIMRQDLAMQDMYDKYSHFEYPDTMIQKEPDNPDITDSLDWITPESFDDYMQYTVERELGMKQYMPPSLDYTFSNNSQSLSGHVGAAEGGHDEPSTLPLSGCDYAKDLFKELGPVKYKLITDNPVLSNFPLGARVAHDKKYPRSHGDEVIVIVIGYCSTKLKLARIFSTRQIDDGKMMIFEGMPKNGKTTGYSLY